MGSCCEAGAGNIVVIDESVGTLVWVRRRNGVWWPGRILGPHDIPETCSLLSPNKRSGIPIKLLGREDGNLDWYNLEKSKRVKPFRCGEYDECIERAKHTAKSSCTKPSKYARRDHAILQALELENSRLSIYNNPEATSQTDKTQNISDKLSGLDLISVPPRELSRTAASADNSSKGIRKNTSNDSEDDGRGGKKRMRGLQDLGVGRAVPSFKKKRTQTVHVHDFLKKKDRRRQLKNVLKRTEVVTIPVMSEERTGLNAPNVKVWGMEYDELKGSFSDSTGGDVTNNNINANNCKQKEYENCSAELLETDDFPFVQEQKQTAGSSPVSVPKTSPLGNRPQSDRSSLIETTLMGQDGFQESGSISSGANISHIMHNSGTSNWLHKGKRNSRYKHKTRSMLNVLTPDDESRTVSNRVGVTDPQRLNITHHSCSTSIPSYKPSALSFKRTDGCYLYDVNIEVSPGYSPRHLPCTSLLSNFTGQPVTGRLLEVEVFIDDVPDIAMNSSECLSSSCELGYGDVEGVPETSRKLSKNRLSSNKKIRKLSSLTGSKGPCETEMIKKPDFACVPLKVVFSRLNAALGITSSAEGPT